jgi:hypothetical protein
MGERLEKLDTKAKEMAREAGVRLPENPCSVVICYDDKTGKPVEVGYYDRFLHSLVIGPTGTGKTSRVLKPMVKQDLEKIASGVKLGITLFEPKGDFADDVARMCEKMGIPYTYVNPLREDTAVLNPLEGDAYSVAESVRTVLRSIFGKQEAFFAHVQETAARNVILMLKELRGDDLTLLDVVRALRDQKVLKNLVQDLERQIGSSDLVDYFRAEVLGELREKFYQFAMGLRQQLEDISGNPLLKRVLIGKSSIDLDGHLDKGGHVLLVNTAMGELGHLGDVFGQFLIMHFQNAVFRRPGTEWTRTPHILYIDEFPRYINPDFERLLAIGRSFRCACVLALQALSQLKLEGNPHFVDVVLNNARNWVVFGGLSAEEAKRFEKEFGADRVDKVSRTYNGVPLVPGIQVPERSSVSETWEARFDFTYIKELPARYVIYRIVRDGSVQPPGLGEARRVDEKTGGILRMLFGLKRSKAAGGETVQESSGDLGNADGASGGSAGGDLGPPPGVAEPPEGAVGDESFGGCSAGVTEGIPEVPEFNEPAAGGDSGNHTAGEEHAVEGCGGDRGDEYIDCNSSSAGDKEVSGTKPIKVGMPSRFRKTDGPG